MIEFDRFELDNKLKVIVHEDKTSPLVAVNLLYDIGAKDENPEMTGFAHLFEHLMFGGSKNIPSYDTPLQQAAGENNAFTNNDYTNYYLTIPKSNIETGLWLESDRMLELAFTQKSLDVQKQVVIEEFKQRYLNQPYGDTWLHLRPLVYKEHPYQWPTIGKDISHIENANLDDVKDFFFKHYAPNNANLCLSGNINLTEAKELTNKWFGDIPARQIKARNLPVEPKQTEARFLQVEKNVPFDLIFKAYHMPRRRSANFHNLDLISDVLSNGKSARLFQRLVKEKKLFSDLNAYLTGELECGLLIVTGKLIKGINIQDADAAIQEELLIMTKELVSDYELQKVKNKVEATLLYNDSNILNKAMSLSFYELLGDANLINQEINKYQKVTKEDILKESQQLFQASNCSTMYYLAKN